MSDVFVLIEVTATCQDGISRQGCSVVVRDAQYVFLNGDGEPLEGDCRVVEIERSVAPMDPEQLSMLTSKYGPILS